jgi:hypothetical protein
MSKTQVASRVTADATVGGAHDNTSRGFDGPGARFLFAIRAWEIVGLKRDLLGANRQAEA